MVFREKSELVKINVFEFVFLKTKQFFNALKCAIFTRKNVVFSAWGAGQNTRTQSVDTRTRTQRLGTRTCTRTRASSSLKYETRKIDRKIWLDDVA
jgi:hypothetical protein